MTTRRGILAARRWTGMGGVASLALAVLVFGCVLVATAGPRIALNSRTKALQTTLDTLAPADRTISVATSLNNVVQSAGEITADDSQLTGLGDQFRTDFNGDGGLRMQPGAADWSSLTTQLESVRSALPGVTYGVEMEVGYRLPLAGNLRVLSGSLSAPAPRPAKRSATEETFRGPFYFYPVLDVAVAQQVASKFGLKLGSAVRVNDLGPSAPANTPYVTLKVAAIVAQAQPDSSFWGADPSMAAPQLNVPGGGSPDYWTAGVFALPGESGALQSDYLENMNVQWVLPVRTDLLLGNQAGALLSGLLTATTILPRLTGPMGAVSGTLRVTSGLLNPATQFVGAAASVDVLLWLLYVSLAVIAAAVLALTAWMITVRRAGELTLLRARGATLLHAGLTVGGGTLISCVPAAALAVAVAVLAVPGPVPPGGWWPGLAVLAAAVGVPALLAAWQQRSPRTRRGQAAAGYSRPGHPGSGYGALGYGKRRRFWGGTRLVTDVTLVLAAVAGLLVFRQQGLQPGSGVDFYTSAAPALVAIPAVVVVLRLYPLVVRGLLHGAARGRGAGGFVGLARAARAALSPALPTFALVLAVTVAAFAGMVRDAVTRGEVNASWAAVGADAVVSTYGPSPTAIPAAAQRAIETAPGVTHAAVATEWLMTALDGSQVTAIAVDPAAYAALTASSQNWPEVNPAQLAGNQVLVSPQALAALGGSKAKAATLSIDNGVEPIHVRIAGTLTATNATTNGTPFVLMSDATAGHEQGAVPDVVLLNGSGINGSQLTALAGKQAPSAGVTLRSKVQAQLASAPVQGGAFTLLILALVVAAALGLAIMLLQLALGAAEREATLARLATMGLTEGQRARLVLLEILPAVLAAAVAAVASGLALPKIVAPAVNLSVFTGTSANVPLVPDAAALAAPLAGLAVAAAVALGIEIRARRKVVATLRGGE